MSALLDDIVELKPHIFVSVPRLWNRIYDKVMAQVLYRCCYGVLYCGTVLLLLLLGRRRDPRA